MKITEIAKLKLDLVQKSLEGMFLSWIFFFYLKYFSELLWEDLYIVGYIWFVEHLEVEQKTKPNRGKVTLYFNLTFDK